MKKICLIVLLGILGIASTLEATAQEAQRVNLAELRLSLEQIEQQAEAINPSAQQLSAALKQLAPLRTKATQCVSNTENVLAPLQKALAAVEKTSEGGAAEPESTEIKSRQEEKAKLESRATECRLLVVQIKELGSTLTDRQGSLLRARLSTRGDSIDIVLANNLRELNQWVTTLNSAFEYAVSLKSFENIPRWFAAAVPLLGLIIGLWIRSVLRRYTGKNSAHEGLSFITRLLNAIAATLGRYAPLLVPAGFASALCGFALQQVSPQPFLALFAYGVTAYLMVVIIVRSLLKPATPAMHVTNLPDSLAHALANRLQALSILVLIAFLIAATLHPLQLPQSAWFLARAGLAVLIFINIGWLIWLAGKVPVFKSSGQGIRLLMLVFLAIILAAELRGYRQLSEYLGKGLAVSMMAGALFWLFSILITEFYDSLDAGRMRWQQGFRKRLGLQQEEPIPGLLWFRFFSAVVLWVFIGMLILWAWGVSEKGFTLIKAYLVDGFVIAETRIVPSHVLAGGLIFAVLLAIFRGLKGTLQNSWLKRTRLDFAARETLVTITGYIGAIVAAMVGLSIAGVSFANLAIVAGALSLGIGFGLQNIVNNFVSGIIMLFERPVRTGDWVVVGATEGYVKKISVRATEIQTFDRADVIVPNSEFISSPVTNWTLRDSYGRIIVRVGVAYGSDTALVKRVMLEVAHQHPQVVQTTSLAPAPKVLFFSFGDSSLNFELRCFVQDISGKLDTLSDLNFAIDKAFRDNEIEIPFPQRDIHVRGDTNEHKLANSDE